MSSSSSPPEGAPLIALFDESVAELEARSPMHLARTAEALAGRRVEVRVGRARFAVEAARGSVRRTAPDLDAPLAVEATDRQLLALLDGERDLTEAAKAGALVLSGRLADLAAFHEALTAFLHGCVRASGSAARLERYRRSVLVERGGPG
ncbi:MAG: hypothetical protein ACFCGT_18630 [Sandaracinaceae bacterium]